jgi:hypothetical protein
MLFGNKVSPILIKLLMKTKSLGFIVLPLMNLLSLSNTFIVFNYFQLSFSLAILFFGGCWFKCAKCYICYFNLWQKNIYIYFLVKVVTASMHPSQCNERIMSLSVVVTLWQLIWSPQGMATKFFQSPNLASTKKFQSPYLVTI